MALAEWGRSGRARVRTVAELDAVLERAAAEARALARPQLVQLTRDAAGTLGIVVGADRSFLSHTPADLQPPYMVSLGEQRRDAPFVFYVAGGHYSETSQRNTVDQELARAALRHFLLTGELSQELDWEQA
jgi:hypothetical protein